MTNAEEKGIGVLKTCKSGVGGQYTYKQRAFKHYEMCEQVLPGHANAPKVENSYGPMRKMNRKLANEVLRKSTIHPV